MLGKEPLIAQACVRRAVAGTGCGAGVERR